MTDTPHTCHARACVRRVPPELLMCPGHWRRLPKAIQYAVWKAYRPGQCELRDGLRPSAAWFEAANTAIGYIADLEGQPLTASERDALERWRHAKPADLSTSPAIAWDDLTPRGPDE